MLNSKTALERDFLLDLARQFLGFQEVFRYEVHCNLEVVVVHESTGLRTTTSN